MAMFGHKTSKWLSPKMILMAKSEIHAIHVWYTVENLVCQRAGRREHDFAISIKNDEEPCRFSEAMLVHRSFGVLVSIPSGVDLHECPLEEGEQIHEP
jgi:hypothetical protein